MITGGSEAALTPLGTACFIALKALSKRNDEPHPKASRPWDADRDGFVLAEGAGIVVLEEYEHAKARGARIYGEFLGASASRPTARTSPPRSKTARALRLPWTGPWPTPASTPTRSDYINAHGTSTGLGDLAETRAIKLTFGEDTRTPSARPSP